MVAFLSPKSLKLEQMAIDMHLLAQKAAIGRLTVLARLGNGKYRLEKGHLCQPLLNSRLSCERIWHARERLCGMLTFRQDSTKVCKACKAVLHFLCL